MTEEKKIITLNKKDNNNYIVVQVYYKHGETNYNKYENFNLLKEAMIQHFKELNEVMVKHFKELIETFNSYDIKPENETGFIIAIDNNFFHAINFLLSLSDSIMTMKQFGYRWDKIIKGEIIA